MTTIIIHKVLLVLEFGAYWSRIIRIAVFLVCIFQTIFKRLVSKEDLGALLKIVLLLTFFSFILFCLAYWAAFGLGDGLIRQRRRRIN